MCTVRKKSTVFILFVSWKVRWHRERWNAQIEYRMAMISRYGNNGNKTPFVRSRIGIFNVLSCVDVTVIVGSAVKDLCVFDVFIWLFQIVLSNSRKNVWICFRRLVYKCVNIFSSLRSCQCAIEYAEWTRPIYCCEASERGRRTRHDTIPLISRQIRENKKCHLTCWAQWK